MLANSKGQGDTVGDETPGASVRSLIEIELLLIKIQTLIDTGAKLSCISENLLQCSELFKNLRIRKCDKRAFGVNGEPVITLGIVDLEFKIDGLTFTHPFTVLRGLIHPMLLGMDFLLKYKANIDLGLKPAIQLNHPKGGKAVAPLIRSNLKTKPSTHVALVNEIEIPPMHSYYADAYIANVECIKPLIEGKPDRLLGITSVQKIDEFFDPGFIMRDAIVSTEKDIFKVELVNPSDFPLKVSEDTPLGAIFDYDCEVMEVSGEEPHWEEEPPSHEEKMLRKQALLTSSVCIVETEKPDTPRDEDVRPKGEWKMKPPDPTLKEKKPDVMPGQAPPEMDQTYVKTSPLIRPKQQGELGHPPWASPKHRESPSQGDTPRLSRMDSPLSAPKHRGNQLENPSTNQNSQPNTASENIFSMAYADGTEELKYSDVHGKDASKDEKTFMVDMEDSKYEGGQRKRLESVLEICNEAFTKNERETGCTDVIVHHVKIPSPKPVYISYKRAQGPEIRKEVDNQTDGFLAAGIVKESESPYCSPIVMVRKKYGGWRYCVDLRRINQMTEKVTFPMPRIEDALRKFKKPKYFSTMDLYKAYYQVPVAEEDQKYYAFSDGKRHLQFTRCPMGAKNSGSTLAMLMELVLRGLPPECVIGYLDDILLATEDWDTHMVLLEKLLKSIIQAKLKLCPSKCQFGRKEVKTLGFRLSEEGIRPDIFNLNKIEQWTECKNVSEVRTYLGLTGYYRSLVPRYAHIASPLSDLTHDGVEWKWGEKEKEAFTTLKQIIMSEPVAAYPDFDIEFLLKTDASKVAMGAILGQMQEKRERMIATMSKKFTEAELKWIPYDREFLAMIASVRHFSHYLRWSHFKLITDHKPLLAWKDVTTQKDAGGKRTRWVLELSTYDVEVTYKEGKRHGDADALSRHPHPDEATGDENEREVLSALTPEMGEEVPLMEEPNEEEMDDMLKDEKTRQQRMARELSRFNVSVIYRESGMNQNMSEPAATPSEDSNNNFICSLSMEEEVELDFLAADSMSEIALVEINADEEVNKEMGELQDADENISKVKTMLKQNLKDEAEWRCVPNWYRQNRDGFATSHNILYHVKTMESGRVARMVVPKSKVKEMLYRCHGCKQSGHPGHLRAKARLEKFAVWHGMGKDIEEHVRKCPECQAARMNVPRKVAPIQPQRAMAPLQFVQADLFKTGLVHDGFNYVAVFEDRFTKFAKFYALKDTKAKGVAKCMEMFVTQLGCPEVWGTDGGPEFYNALALAMCHIFNVKKTFSLAHRPQTNGQIERLNRHLKSELAKRIKQFGKDWPSYLKWIELAYNTTPHPGHGHTPFLLMYGREARLPMQHDIPKIDTTGWQSTMKSYLPDFLDRMAKYQKQAMATRALYQIQMVKQHDKNVLEPLQPGNQVLRLIPNQFRSKLDLPKDGPWRVEEQRVKHGRVLPVYKIKNEEDKIILSHRESLSKFEEAEGAENLIVKEQEQVVRPKEKKTKQKAVTDGPASRTRSRRADILYYVDPQRPAPIPQAAVAIVGNDDDGDNGGNNHGDEGGDGGDEDGDGGDEDGDGGEGDENGNDDSNQSDAAIDAEQFQALPLGNADEVGEEDAVDNRLEEQRESIDEPTFLDDEDRSHDEFNDAGIMRESAFNTPNQSYRQEAGNEREERGYETADSGGSAPETTAPEAIPQRLTASSEIPTASPELGTLPWLRSFITNSGGNRMELCSPPVLPTRNNPLTPETASPGGVSLNPQVPEAAGESEDPHTADGADSDGHVVEIFTSKSGVQTEVKRSTRNRKSPNE